MRWLFVLLVLANGFYAVWQLQVRPADSYDETGVEGLGRVSTLVLVDEADPAVLESAEAPLAIKRVPEQIADACWFVSIFEEKAQADKAVAAVQAAQLEARLETVEVADRSDYWVHVGPYASRERALAELQQLRADGIDSFLIGDGELKNAISLGFFSQKASAERLMRKHRDIGQPIRLFEVKRYKPSYHLYASGRVEEAQLVALMKDQGQVVSPAKKPKKSCI